MILTPFSRIVPPKDQRLEGKAIIIWLPSDKQACSAAGWEWAAEVTQHSANTKHYTNLTTGLYSLPHIL